MAKVKLREWSLKIQKSLPKLGAASTIELFSSAILDTRVKTGRARGNWQASVGTPIGAEINRKDKDGGMTVEHMKRVVKPGEVNYLTNNLPYIGFLEELDGMVEKNILRVRLNLQRGKKL